MKGRLTMSIRENLNQRDMKNGNKYDLLNLFESISWETVTPEQKRNTFKYITENSSDKDVYNILYGIYSRNQIKG